MIFGILGGRSERTGSAMIEAAHAAKARNATPGKNQFPTGTMRRLSAKGQSNLSNTFKRGAR